MECMYCRGWPTLRLLWSEKALTEGSEHGEGLGDAGGGSVTVYE